jgi:phage/plasmid-associated DNA primase
MKGDFHLILACNAQPVIKLDQDVDAWSRRLVVVNFKKPDHERHLRRMADVLVNQELSGVLNWLQDG